MFYQERDTEVKSNPSALFGVIALFDFGLCIWQSIWRLWSRSSEDQQKWCKEWGPAPKRGLSGIRTVWLGEGKTKGWFNCLQVFERTLYGRCRTDVLYFHRRPNKRKYFKIVAREKVQLIIKMAISIKKGLNIETGNQGIWEVESSEIFKTRSR